MIIIEFIDFFVYSLDLIWWSLGRVYIPETPVNGQFLFIFTLILTLGWKVVLQRTLPPVKVDNIEISNNSEKKKQTFNRISRKRKG